METTDIVQLISLPLEVCGLFLTITQVFFKGFDTRLEIWFSKKLDDLGKWLIDNNKLLYRLFRIYFIGLIAFPPLIISILRTLVQYGYLEEAWFSESYFTQYLWFHIAFMYLLLAISMLQNLQKLLPKKNLLAFGIWLTGLGIIGEAYQVYKIFW